MWGPVEFFRLTGLIHYVSVKYSTATLMLNILSCLCSLVRHHTWKAYVIPKRSSIYIFSKYFLAVLVGVSPQNQFSYYIKLWHIANIFHNLLICRGQNAGTPIITNGASEAQWPLCIFGPGAVQALQLRVIYLSGAVLQFLAPHLVGSDIKLRKCWRDSKNKTSTISYYIFSFFYRLAKAS